jgi:membrane protein implicated in regulation of membrane protease activity
LNKESILPGLLGEATYWAPIIVLLFLSLFDTAYLAVLAAVYAVWVWLLPAIPIQLLFILFYKKLIQYLSRKIRERKEKNNDYNQ